MPNNLSIIVDRYLDLTDQEPENYKRHLKGAKQVLELCEGDVEKACELLEGTKEWVNSWGGEEWTLETCVKFWVNNLIKKL